MIRPGLHPLQRPGHWAARLTIPLLLACAAGGAHAQAEGEAAVMKRAAALREAPAESGRSLADLAADAPVTRLSQRQGAWVRVRDAQGTTGWVHLFDVGSPGGSSAAGGASAALRSVTGFFSRDRNPRTTTATSTLGIRGLGAEDLAQAQPDAGGVGRMEALRQNETQARQFARESSLVPAQVDPLPVPVRATATQNNAGQSP